MELPNVIKPFFFFYNAEISDCYVSHYILIEYHCFILTVLSQKLIFVIWNGNGIARLFSVLKIVCKK